MSSLNFGIFGEIGTASTRPGYIGKELDSESDLADHGVRKYDYITGRFMAVDPLWEEYRSWTTYGYTRNNPIGLIDPTGFGDEQTTGSAIFSSTLTLVGSGFGLALGTALVFAPTGITQVIGGALIATSITSGTLAAGTLVAALDAESKGQKTIGYMPLGIGEAVGYGLDKGTGGDGTKGAAIGGLIEAGAGIAAGGLTGKSATYVGKLGESVTSIDAIVPNTVTGLSLILPIGTLLEKPASEKPATPTNGKRNEGDPKPKNGGIENMNRSRITFITFIGTDQQTTALENYVRTEALN